MKTCSDCIKTLSINHFHKKPRNKDGYDIRCKDCRNTKYNKADPRRVFAKIYASQIEHSITRGMAAPDYTLDQLKHWVDQQPHAHSLWSDYVDNNYDRWAKPSVDRIDNNLPYTLSNIRLTTWKENHQLGADAKKAGTLNANQKGVAAYTKQGQLFREFTSVNAALRHLGGGSMHGVTSVANGVPIKDGKGKLYTPRSYKGFKWEWI
jgi:hypothetical protein